MTEVRDIPAHAQMEVKEIIAERRVCNIRLEPEHVPK